MTKKELRQLLKQKRQVLSISEREQAALAAAKIFVESSLFFSSHKFSTYIATEQELNLHPIIEVLWDTQKEVYLPSVLEDTNKRMQFKHYATNSKLRMNRYNILEPLTKETIPATELDIVLLPLLGFDSRGVRIGSGGGYYDTTFWFLNNNPRPIKPQLIGVGFEAQFVEQIPHDEWDVLLDGVLTEQRLIFF